MVRDVVLWWARQMRAVLPRRLLPGADRGDALVIAARPPSLLLTLRRRGRETPLGRFSVNDDGLSAAVAALRRRPRQVILKLGSDAMLERAVTLPLAAERDLDSVVGFEMDRLTPFAAADVVWQAEVTRRDPAQRRLWLRLTLVPRRTLQPWLDRLARAGLVPAWLEATASDGAPRRMMLDGKAAHRRGGRATAVAAGVAGVLALAAVVMPFVMQSLTGAATESAIQALGPRVDRVEALRKRLADGAADADVLAAERVRVGNVLAVLAAVTDIMPDDTWLTELSLRQGRLNLSGQSPAAARLIPALAADPTFRNPAFAAPVTRAPDGHADLFVIRAELAP
jgi:general secretion pathway protein L